MSEAARQDSSDKGRDFLRLRMDSNLSTSGLRPAFASERVVSITGGEPNRGSGRSGGDSPKGPNWYGWTVIGASSGGLIAAAIIISERIWG